MASANLSCLEICFNDVKTVIAKLPRHNLLDESALHSVSVAVT